MVDDQALLQRVEALLELPFLDVVVAQVGQGPPLDEAVAHRARRHDRFLVISHRLRYLATHAVQRSQVLQRLRLVPPVQGRAADLERFARTRQRFVQPSPFA